MEQFIDVEFVEGIRVIGTAKCSLPRVQWRNGEFGILTHINLERDYVSNWLDMRLPGENVPGLRITLSYTLDSDGGFERADFRVGNYEPEILAQGEGFTGRVLR